MIRGRRAAFVLSLAACFALARPAMSVAGEPLGFDHGIHEGKVVAAANEPPPCAFCHGLDRSQRPVRPGHSACFTPECHGAPPRGLGPLGPICHSCHLAASPTQLSRRPYYPPYDMGRDFGILFAHDRHAASSRAGGRAGCEECHAAPGISRHERKPHGRCAGCHSAIPRGGAKVTMSKCEGCHVAIAGRPVSPHVVRSLFPVTSLFSHASHLSTQRTKGGERCLLCHENVNHASEEAIPAPPMRACESCHDGKSAFSTHAPSCRLCHAKGERAALPALLANAPYEHRAHAARGAPSSCSDCHGLDTTGAPTPPSARHFPCASADCHADDFRSATPRTCGTCHVGTEPFRALKADAPRRPVTEFGVEFSHARHAPISPWCEACHVGITGGPEMRLGKGHASCSTHEGGTPPCHAASQGPEPRLLSCDACHVMGLYPARDEARARSPWSVADRFSHARHHFSSPSGPSGDPLPCEGCHVGASAANALSGMRPPPKNACTACHNGAVAFKVTGHDCVRCHGKRPRH
ncbi:MAG: hypothetical protein HY698_17575 [Deltaproteobacteria bacterium]|nr:hypothetical protein [Deltaproteobacteria bacterium]